MKSSLVTIQTKAYVVDGIEVMYREVDPALAEMS